MEDGPFYTMQSAQRRAERDMRAATRIRWVCVATYVAAVIATARHGVTNAEFVVAAVVGLFLAGIFLAAGWIAGRDWRG